LDTNSGVEVSTGGKNCTEPCLQRSKAPPNSAGRKMSLMLNARIIQTKLELVKPGAGKIIIGSSWGDKYS
jgi:hypothetical protein